MSELIDVNILYAEDNPADAELTLRAFKKQRLANHLKWVKDGQEALDYLFRQGHYARRVPMDIHISFSWILKCPRWTG